MNCEEKKIFHSPFPRMKEFSVVLNEKATSDIVQEEENDNFLSGRKGSV